ncbi:MAG: hypothetical protein MJ053_07470, partial [Elusimicrobiaceae bacterium]|nr:hypothetical protein [Elusimicrobiaceae bacterium]
PLLGNTALTQEAVQPLAPTFTEWEHPTWQIYMPQETVRTRSWLKQQQRKFKAWQLKRQHAKQVALAQQIAALPKIQPQRTFYTPHLSGLLVQKANLGTVPQAPFIQRPHYLYRGLTLSNDGSSLRNILRNGLLVDDAGAYSNNLLMSLVNTPQDAAAISSMKYTNLSQSPETAMHYAFRDLQQSDDILPVLVSVTGIEETGPVVRVQYDIPAKQLPQVVVLLRLNDELTWCLIELEGDTFKITPYEVK